MRKMKIYLADDHTLFRNAFLKVLKEIEAVGEIKEASNGKELLDLIKQDIPDVVIVDVTMPVMDGIKVCEKLATDYPEVKVIVISMHDDKLTIYQALKAGVDAFLPKDARLSQFEEALFATIAAKPYTNAYMDEALKYGQSLNAGTQNGYRKVELSEKEKIIIRLICKQYTNRQIALELSLSEHTVRNHRVRMMRKTGAKNTQGLVKFAYENGLFT